MATSGTTGQPKVVVLTHDALAASASATSAMLRVDPATDRWLACLPFAHIGGPAAVIRALLTATPWDSHRPFHADSVAHAARAGRAPTSLVPSALPPSHPTLLRGPPPRR